MSLFIPCQSLCGRFFQQSSRRRLQRADTEDFTGVQRFDLRFADRDDGNGFASGSEDFQTIPRLLLRASGVELDDGGDVAAAETVRGQVGREGDSGVELVFHRGAG